MLPFKKLNSVATYHGASDAFPTTAYPMCQLSVPSKRVETLPPARIVIGHNTPCNFQYPQSGSRPCRKKGTVGQNWTSKLSVPSKRVETLPPGHQIGNARNSAAFSTLKAGRDLAALTGHGECLVRGHLSVPSKRVETLPLLATMVSVQT
jgi:hypothetical protein